MWMSHTHLLTHNHAYMVNHETHAQILLIRTLSIIQETADVSTYTVCMFVCEHMQLQMFT